MKFYLYETKNLFDWSVFFDGCRFEQGQLAIL